MLVVSRLAAVVAARGFGQFDAAWSQLSDPLVHAIAIGGTVALSRFAGVGPVPGPCGPG